MDIHTKALINRLFQLSHQTVHPYIHLYYEVPAASNHKFPGLVVQSYAAVTAGAWHSGRVPAESDYTTLCTYHSHIIANF